MRKETIVTIDDRGTPLTFKIREMPATKLEAWIMRAVLIVTRGGIEVPKGANFEAAIEHVLREGLWDALQRVDYDLTKGLLDELLTCCHRQLEGGGEQPVTLTTVDGYVQSVSTLVKLRWEALKMNLDFFEGGGLSAFPFSPTEKSTPNSST